MPTIQSSSATSNDKRYTPWWHTPISAGIGGTIGGWVCFALEGLKKRAQSNQAISKASFHPRELFRGSTSFATSVGTTSVAQYTIQRLLHSLPGYDASSTTWNVTTSISSGMCGAFFSTAVENIILQQQLSKVSPSQAIKELFQQGLLRPWLGLPELMAREGGFALALLYLTKAVKDKIQSQTDNQFALYSGQIGLGVLGAAFTHPFDTLATYKQRHLVTSQTAFMNIYRQLGIAGFYKGLTYRATLFVGCIAVIPFAEKKANAALRELSLFTRPKPPQSPKSSGGATLLSRPPKNADRLLRP